MQIERNNKICLLLCLLLGCFLLQSVRAAVETELLVDTSATSDTVTYLKTQWYGFTAASGKGYCVQVTPVSGDSDAYLLGGNFNLAGSSKNTGLTADKIWYGQSTAGPLHIGCFGKYNPSSKFSVAVITAPCASAISPASGIAGTLVTITGFGFLDTQGGSYVKFGSVKATQYYSWSNTQIRVYVPSGIGSGAISVLVNVVSRDSNALSFTSNIASSEGTMWRYNFVRDANYPNGPSALPVSQKWKYSIGNNCDWMLVTSTMVYAVGMKLYALDATTGAYRWSYTPDIGIPGSTPCVAAGKLYFGTNYGDFYALDAASGALKWKYTLPPYQNHSRTIHSSPLVDNNIVYFVASATSTGSELFALDANTGGVKWSCVIPESISCAPILVNKTFYVAKKNIYAINADTGLIKSKSLLPKNRYLNKTMSYSGGILYLGTTDPLSGGAVYAFDTATLSIKWEYRTSGWFGDLAVANGKVICSGMNNLGSSLVVLDAASGLSVWTGDAYGTAPVISKSILYIVGAVPNTSESRVKALDLVSAVEKWSYRILNDIAIAVEPVNGKIYFATGNGYIYCFGL